jgi:hypothetical protein
MKETPSNPKRPKDVPGEPPPEGGLTIVLWVIAVFLAVLEISWWWAASIYS